MSATIHQLHPGREGNPHRGSPGERASPASACSALSSSSASGRHQARYASPSTASGSLLHAPSTTRGPHGPGSRMSASSPRTPRVGLPRRSGSGPTWRERSPSASTPNAGSRCGPTQDAMRSTGQRPPVPTTHVARRLRGPVHGQAPAPEPGQPQSHEASLLSGPERRTSTAGASQFPARRDSPQPWQRARPSWLPRRERAVSSALFVLAELLSLITGIDARRIDTKLLELRHSVLPVPIASSTRGRCSLQVFPHPFCHYGIERGRRRGLRQRPVNVPTSVRPERGGWEMAHRSLAALRRTKTADLRHRALWWSSHRRCNALSVAERRT